MEKKELIAIVIIIFLLSVVVIASAIFYFSFIMNSGVSGHVVYREVENKEDSSIDVNNTIEKIDGKIIFSNDTILNLSNN